MNSEIFVCDLVKLEDHTPDEMLHLNKIIIKSFHFIFHFLKWIFPEYFYPLNRFPYFAP